MMVDTPIPNLLRGGNPDSLGLFCCTGTRTLLAGSPAAAPMMGAPAMAPSSASAPAATEGEAAPAAAPAQATPSQTPAPAGDPRIQCLL